MGNSNSRSDSGSNGPNIGSNGLKEKPPTVPIGDGASSAVNNAMLKAERTMSRSASGADVTEKNLTQLVPIEKLSQILKEKSNKHGVNGIVSEVFVSQVFPLHVDLGRRLFRLMHTLSKATTFYLGTVAFRQQCERFLGIMDDDKVLECYIKMFADEENPDFITKEGVTRLLFTCYTIAMQHSGNAVLCPAVPATRMYWETESDVYNHLVAGSMARHKFEKIHRYLHFNDNTQIDVNNKAFKVQPNQDHLNTKFKELGKPFTSNSSRVHLTTYKGDSLKTNRISSSFSTKEKTRKRN